MPEPPDAPLEDETLRAATAGPALRAVLEGLAAAALLVRADQPQAEGEAGSGLEPDALRPGVRETQAFPQPDP